MSMNQEKALVQLINISCNNLDGILHELKLPTDDKEQIKTLLKSIEKNANSIIIYYRDLEYVSGRKTAIITACKAIKGIVMKLERKQIVLVHRQLKAIRTNLKNLAASLQVELAA